MKGKRYLRLVGIIGLALVMVAFLFMGACAPAEEEPVVLALLTSSVGGTWMIVGTAVSEIVKGEYPYISISPESSGGSADNIRLLGGAKADIGLCTPDIVYQAWNREGPFSDLPQPITNVRGMFGGHGNYTYFYTLEKNPIKKMEDLRGKKISLGGHGSIGNWVGDEILKLYGMEMGVDWTPEYLGHGEGATALGDGHVDAVLLISSIPTTAIATISATHDIRILQPDKDKMEAFVSALAGWSLGTVPAGVYRGVDYPVETAVIPSTLICVDTVPEDIIYKITKAIQENHDKMVAVHPLGQEWRTEFAKRGIEGILPWHPGAEKYFKEIGVL